MYLLCVIATVNILNDSERYDKKRTRKKMNERKKRKTKTKHTKKRSIEERNKTNKRISQICDIIKKTVCVPTF